MADEYRNLSQAHTALITGSAISNRVAAARGYRTITDRAELRQLGFSAPQARVPALLVPVHGVAGGIITHQIRPDRPRTVRGKELKYETPRGSRMCLDVPPLVREKLGDPTIPLLITEGVRKADAAVSHGLICIGLLGVWNWRGTNAQGGKTAVGDFEAIALNDREVFITFDSDVMVKPPVQAALARLRSFLASRGARVRVIYLPEDDGDKVGLDDYLAAGHTVDELLMLATTELLPAPPGESGSGLPVIHVTGRPLREVTADAVAAIVAANDPPELFVRFGALARVRADEHGRPLIETASPPIVRHRLARVAECVRVVRDTALPVPPPRELVEDLLALGTWPMPPLEAVTEVPVLRPDGTVLDQPGYDPATRLVYLPAPGLELAPVPAAPTAAQVQAALEAVREPLSEFPFTDAAGLANALALLLTPVLRPAISGPVPLALIDKPKRGTGASLLAFVIEAVAVGKVTDLMTAPHEDEEWRKKITAALLFGTTIMFFDNVEHPLSSPSLAAALTAPEWCDRILGRSEVVRLPQRATWMATGNNLRVGGDLARRCYWIRLDAQVARPWQRDGFRHGDLLGFILRNRGGILAAVLTLARAWFAAGCPKADVPKIGGFEGWASTIGGVLAHAGVEGFLRNLDELYDQVDEDEVAWEAFLAAWQEQYRERVLTVAELAADLRQDGNALRPALPGDLADALALDGKGKVSFAKRLGQALRKRADGVYGALKLVRLGRGDQNTTRWQVAEAVGSRIVRISGLGPSPYARGEVDAQGATICAAPEPPRHPAETNPENPTIRVREPGEDDGDPDEPARACRVCGRSEWWQQPSGAVVCDVCHPSPRRLAQERAGREQKPNAA